jgi:integrase
MRRGEILGLKWRDVDFDTKRIVIQETKNGERRAVPLVGMALHRRP